MKQITHERVAGMHTKHDVIVIGAGMAGLTTAHDLTRAGRSVHVIEARDRVGGRLKGGTLSDGQWIELGGQWIGPGQDRVYDLARELDLQTIPTYNEGHTIVKLGKRQTTMGSARGAIPKLSPFALADLAQGLAKFQRISKSIDLHAPWKSPRARMLDHETFDTWIRRNLRTKAGRAYFHVACEAVFSADPGDMSALHAAFYARSGIDLETLMSVDRGAQQDRIDGGSVLLAERLADRVRNLGVRIDFGTPVDTIRVADDAHVITRDGTVHRAHRVIVAIPPALASRITYDPPLPGTRDQLTQRLPMGSVVKTFTVYDRPFWRDRGLNGQVGSDTGPVKVTFDATPPGYDRGIMLGFIEGDEARGWMDLDPAERQRRVIDCYVGYFGEDARHPVEFVEHDWASETFSRGCYGAHFTTGTWTAYGRYLREPIGPIHWAGTEYATEWNGYIEGAIRSGMATAKDILGGLP